MRFLSFRMALVVSVWLGGAVSGRGQSIARAGTDRISIDAEGVPLAALLEELSEIVPVEFMLLAPKVENVPVTLKLSDVHPVLGIHKILEKAEVDYAVSGGDGKPFRIIVGTPELPRGSMLPESGPQGQDDPDEDVVTDIDVAPEAEDRASAPGQARALGSRAGRPFATGMARPGSPDRVTGLPSATGMALPGLGRVPGVPGGVSGSGQPPTGATTAGSPQAMPQRPRERGSPSPSRASGGAILATGSAGLYGRPETGHVAATGAFLGFGLSLGVLLVRDSKK